MANGLPQIEHLVILVMENRSFDHYLGALALEDPSRGIEGLKPDNPYVVYDSKGKPYESWAMDSVDAHTVTDVPHGYGEAHADWNNGANDGFISSFESHHQNDPTIARMPMGYYTRETLSVLYALADNFTVCGHWHSSLLSSTWPNRKYLHSGKRDADNDTQTFPGIFGFGTTPIYDAIAKSCDPDTKKPLTWRSYYCDLPFLAFWYGFALKNLQNFEMIDAFVRDCVQERLPTISVIDPPFTLADDHPPHDPAVGEKFIGLVVDALTNSPSWDKSALIIVYDEFGGFFDHAPPPVAPEPEPLDTPLGFRVPALVVSPYAKQKYVSHKVYDHTSVMQSIAKRWRVPFADDSNTFGTRWQHMPAIWDDCFDFSRKPQQNTYTGRALHEVTWGKAVRERLASPLGEFEAALQRVFVLPELITLDKRADLYDTLGRLENSVISIKRAASYANAAP